MNETQCYFKKYYMYPLSFAVGYIGFILYKKYDNNKYQKPIKNYIAGGLSEINTECNELKDTVKSFLKKSYNYEDDFIILGGTQQVVAGIKYNMKIQKKNSEELDLHFIHRPWLDEKDIFHNLDDTKD